MSLYYIALQTDYETIQFGLYNHTLCLANSYISKIDACSLLMLQLDTLITYNQLTWEDIIFIGINNGPGPFTTLRAMIATVNGISFAMNIPIIAINGLYSLINEYSKKNDFRYTIALLNAFGGDLYFAINDNETNKIIITGCEKNTIICERIFELNIANNILLLGNGVTFISEQIVLQNNQNKIFTIKILNYTTCSLAQIANDAYIQWNSSIEKKFHVSPLYLKTINYPISHIQL